MILRKRLKNQTVLAIGMMAMAIAGTANLFLRRHLPLSENAADAIIGFLYGIAISTMLLGIWRRGRERSAAGDRCA
jgi:hypothetical protein